MKEIIIDCGMMDTKDMIYPYLEKVFEAEDGSITDLDSLLDYLTGIENSMEITFEDVDLLEINFGEFGNEILEIFEQAERSNENIKLV